MVIIILPLLLLASFMSCEINARTRDQAQQQVLDDLHIAQTILQQRTYEILSTTLSIADLITSFNFIEISAFPPEVLAASSDRAVRALQRATHSTRSSFQIFIERILNNKRIDFLVVTDDKGRVVFRSKRPENIGDNLADHSLVRHGLENKSAGSLVLEPVDRLTREGLEESARVRLLANAASKPIDKSIETSALVIEAVTPIISDGLLLGTVLAGDVLNNDLALVDEIRKRLYKGHPESVGVAIYLHDGAVATNFSAEDGKRAVGMRAPAEPASEVLGKGKEQFSRRETLFQDTYINAYQPLKDIRNTIVGMLHIGVKERWYQQSQAPVRSSMFQVALLSMAVFVIIAAVAADRFSKPITDLSTAYNKISLGELDLSIKAHTGDEIETLAESMERMRFSLKMALDRLRRR